MVFARWPLMLVHRLRLPHSPSAPADVPFRSLRTQASLVCRYLYTYIPGSADPLRFRRLPFSLVIAHLLFRLLNSNQLSDLQYASLFLKIRVTLSTSCEISPRDRYQSIFSLPSWFTVLFSTIFSPLHFIDNGCNQP